MRAAVTHREHRRHNTPTGMVSECLVTPGCGVRIMSEHSLTSLVRDSRVDDGACGKKR